MAMINVTRMEALTRKAEVLRSIFLLSREEQMAAQLAANVDVRIKGIACDSTWAIQCRLTRFAIPAISTLITTDFGWNTASPSASLQGPE